MQISAKRHSIGTKKPPRCPTEEAWKIYSEDYGLILRPAKIWHVNNRYVSISGVGKRLVHYRMLKQPGQASAAAHVASKQELLAYFERHSAQEVTLSTKP